VDPLHQIIQSLTPNEKRYFALFAATFRSESELVKLFEVMERQQEFNAAEIKKEASIKNLPEAKNSLRKLIFKAMRNYHEDRSVKEQLRQALGDVDFLLKKGLDLEAKKEINKAWKLAEKNEAYGDIAEMLDRLSNIKLRMLDGGERGENFDELLKSIEEAGVKHQEVYAAIFYNRYLTFLMATNQYIPASPSGKDLNEIINKINLQLKTGKSPFAQCTLLITLAGCYQAIGPIHKAKETYSEIAALFKKSPLLIEIHPTAYLSFIFNYGIISTNYGTREMAWSLIEQAEQSFILLKDFFKASPQKRIYYRERLTVIKLTYTKIHKQWQLLNALEAETNRHLKGKDIKERVVLALQVAGLVCCFYQSKNYTKALEWANVYYQLEDAKLVKPLMTCVRVLEALAYHGNRQYDMSDNRCINLYKSFIEQKMTGQFYKYLGAMLRKINHWDLNNALNRKEIEGLIADFESLKDQPDYSNDGHSEYYEPAEILQALLAGNK
jgi:hypothetical protein